MNLLAASRLDLARDTRDVLELREHWKIGLVNDNYNGKRFEKIVVVGARDRPDLLLLVEQNLRPRLVPAGSLRVL